jgi:predicted nucleotide-binding protein
VRSAINHSRTLAFQTLARLGFVIHGRQSLGEFHSFLRALGLKPLWSDARNRTKKPNPSTWEIVDSALMSGGTIVALLTADDEARLRPALMRVSDAEFENSLMPQPRQNVLFEAGVAYGRDHQRTVLVRIGKQRPMSDLAGHHILTLDDSASAGKAVADALRVAGCSVDISGSDWLTVGTFRG